LITYPLWLFTHVSGRADELNDVDVEMAEVRISSISLKAALIHQHDVRQLLGASSQR
jgi:hypothetical protein